jgi:hypothetical protein
MQELNWPIVLQYCVISNMISKVIFGVLAYLAGVSATALDDYVWRVDENYGWVDMGPEHVISGTNLYRNRTWTGYTLNMTSQRWLTGIFFQINVLFFQFLIFCLYRC